MAQIPPIEDAYIDDIIKAAGAYNPAVRKTQGVKLRELMKLFRDRFEQQVNAVADSSAEAIKVYDVSKTYDKDEMVYAEDESQNRIIYQSLQSNNTGNPYTDTSKWKSLGYPKQNLTFSDGLTQTGNIVRLGGSYTGEVRLGGIAGSPLLGLGSSDAAGTYTTLNVAGSDYSAGTQSFNSGSQLSSSLFLTKSVNEASVKLQDDGGFKMLVTDQLGNKGLEEAGDYSANKTDYSYVTKKMLTGGLAGLSKVASTGLYSDLVSKPSKLSEFTDDLDYSSYAKVNGSNAMGTWGIGISGNAATATNSGQWSGLEGQNILSAGAQSGGLSNLLGVHSNGFAYQFNADAIRNFLSLGSFATKSSINGNEVHTEIGNAAYDGGVAQVLRWKNYGNGHVIFDASQGTSPTGSAINNAEPENYWTPSYPTLMGWNGATTFGVRVQSSSYADRATNMQTTSSIGVHLIYGNAAPFISLAIGDNDTGFHALGDGSTAYYSNGVQLFQLNNASTLASYVGLNNGSTLSNHINGNSATSTFASYINCPDGDRNPNSILPQNNPNRVRFDFTNAALTGTGGNYSGTMTFSPWSGTTPSTGDASYQLVFGSTGANGTGVPMLKIRKGIDASWNEFYDLWTTANLAAPAITAQANTLVQRDANGYIYASYVNSNRSLENSGAESYIYDTGDGWMRKKTAMNASIELFGQNRHWQLRNDDGGIAYNSGTLELINGATRPVLGLHWAGVVASTISIEQSGRIAILNNPGTSYENLVANSIEAIGGFYDTSDARLKTLTNELFDTRSLKAHTYYKNDKLETGYLAQDVEGILPHAVSSSGEYKTLNYNQVLVNKISNLEEDLSLSRNEIEVLKFQLDKLLKHLSLD